MVDILKIAKLTELPETVTPNSIYLVAPDSATSFIEVYVTSKTNEIKKLPSRELIKILIAEAFARKTLTVVPNISERDASDWADGDSVYVIDATDDPEVEQGYPAYYLRSGGRWYRDNYDAHLDLKIRGFPNRDILLGFNESEGNLTYKGKGLSNQESRIVRKTSSSLSFTRTFFDEQFKFALKPNSTYKFCFTGTVMPKEQWTSLGIIVRATTNPDIKGFFEVQRNLKSTQKMYQHEYHKTMSEDLYSWNFLRWNVWAFLRGEYFIETGSEPCNLVTYFYTKNGREIEIKDNMLITLEKLI